MSGRGIGHLGNPPAEYRIDRGLCARFCGFETMLKSQQEDETRARLMRKLVAGRPPFREGEAVLELAERLGLSGVGVGMPDSLASHVSMRGLRIKVAGALWQLIEECGNDVRFFTIIPRTWELTPEELQDVDPTKLMKALRAALDGQGAGGANGWAIAYLHGEFDGRVYRLHVHGFAFGEMVEVIDRLRNLPNYRTRRFLENGEPSRVYRRVVISRTKLSELPRPITYLMQSFWPYRATLMTDDGIFRRVRWKRRIQEPHHTVVLLWLDRWKVSDLTLMIGLRVTKDGLTQTKPVS